MKYQSTFYWCWALFMASCLGCNIVLDTSDIDDYDAGSEAGADGDSDTDSDRDTDQQSAAPALDQQPSSQTVLEGDMVVFEVSASGAAPMLYQWRKDGVNIPGETSDTFTIASATTEDAGVYTCRVSNVAGNQISDEAALTVTPVYIVTFDGQGATVDSTPGSMSVLVSAPSVESLPTDPTKLGYIFAGWRTKINGYGEEFTATTVVTDDMTVYADWSIVDVDDNAYTEIEIGDQVWMVENFMAIHFNDGTPIQSTSDGWDFVAVDAGQAAYCQHPSLSDNGVASGYGYLYNWWAASDEKFAPDGWRVPTDADWTALQEYLITSGYNYDGSDANNKIAKSLAADADWTISTDPGAIGNNIFANNATGFTALPAGTVDYDSDGEFRGAFQTADWWSATADTADAGKAVLYNLYYKNAELKRYSFNVRDGYSVRLIRTY